MDEIYNYEAGKLYDTIFYMAMYYFEEEMTKKIYKKLNNDSDLECNMRFFNEIKSKCYELSDRLKPLFYCTDKNDKHAFLLNFTVKNINHNDSQFENFISLLLNLTNKSEFVKWYFPNIASSQLQAMYKAKDITLMRNIILQSDIEDEFKLDFLTILLTYEDTISILVDAVKTVYACIQQIHMDNQDVIQQIITTVNDSKNGAVEKLEQVFALQDRKPFLFSFSLLNPFVICYINQQSNKNLFLIGKDFMSSLAFIVDYKHVTYNSFAKVAASDTRRDIIKMFLEYESLSAADIAHNLKLSKPTVYVHLNDMLLEKIIIHIESTGGKLYYTLNDAYLVKFIDYLTRLNEGYLKSKREGTLKHYELPRKRKNSNRD